MRGGVSHVHGTATRARLHTVKYAICFGRSSVSKYLPCINVAGMREAKKHTIACSSIIPRALVRLDLSLSRVTVLISHTQRESHTVCVCLCVCAALDIDRNKNTHA